MSKEEGAAFLNELLDMDIEVAYDECDRLKCAHFTFSWMLEVFSDHYTKALHLDSASGREVERDGNMVMCIRVYLLYLVFFFFLKKILYLVGGTIFTDKNNQYVDAVFLKYL